MKDGRERERRRMNRGKESGEGEKEKRRATTKLDICLHHIQNRLHIEL